MKSERENFATVSIGNEVFLMSPCGFAPHGFFLFIRLILKWRIFCFPHWQQIVMPTGMW